MVTTDQKTRAAELLRQLAGEATVASAAALAGEAAAQEACRLACRALADAVVGGEPEARLVLRYAELRRDHAGRAPWGAVNRVVAAGVGEGGLERVKQRAAALLRSEARPVASARRGEPRYSQRLLSRLR